MTEIDSLRSENSALKARCERMREALQQIRMYVKDVLTPNNGIALGIENRAREALSRAPDSFAAEAKAVKDLEKKARTASDDWDLKCEDGKGKLSDVADALAELDRVRAGK